MMEETKKIAEFFQCGYKIFKKGSEPDKLEDAYYKAFEEGKEKRVLACDTGDRRNMDCRKFYRRILWRWL